MNLENINIEVTKNNQYEIQKFLFDNNYMWCSSKFNFFDVFRSNAQTGEIRHIFINNGLMINSFRSTYEIIDGEIFLRKNKIKRLL